MIKTYLWQEPDFPHFYHNPAVVKPLEEAFRMAVADLDRMMGKQNLGFEDVITL